MENGQGAIEYLLLLAAAVIVVVGVVTLLFTTEQTGAQAVDSGSLAYICDTLDSKIPDCGCYKGDATIGPTNDAYCCQKTGLLRANWMRLAPATCS